MATTSDLDFEPVALGATLFLGIALGAAVRAQWFLQATLIVRYLWYTLVHKIRVAWLCFVHDIDNAADLPYTPINATTVRVYIKSDHTLSLSLDNKDDDDDDDASEVFITRYELYGQHTGNKQSYMLLHDLVDATPKCMDVRQWFAEKSPDDGEVSRDVRLIMRPKKDDAADAQQETDEINIHSLLEKLAGPAMGHLEYPFLYFAPRKDACVLVLFCWLLVHGFDELAAVAFANDIMEHNYVDIEGGKWYNEDAKCFAF